MASAASASSSVAARATAARFRLAAMAFSSGQRAASSAPPEPPMSRITSERPRETVTAAWSARSVAATVVTMTAAVAAKLRGRTAQTTPNGASAPYAASSSPSFAASVAKRSSPSRKAASANASSRGSSGGAWCRGSSGRMAARLRRKLRERLPELRLSRTSPRHRCSAQAAPTQATIREKACTRLASRHHWPSAMIPHT
mmetsp:Transcript_95670/g.298348  ORF Transcript_95670/g.298348 Transcript_95670/m.298348 type:complete len:200 (-) Transcript_95670:80-679(-)